jgi:adenosylmethionine-8-amino-7-oxononanoate aminotransferase
MAGPSPDYEEILALDRAHVIHPITEFAKHERRGAKIFTGGIVVPPPDYFAEIQAICRRHDVLLILDEVITGFGRTGRWFGLEHWDIHPDLLSVAKGISSGYLPLSASVISDRVYETLRDRMPRGLPFMFGLTSNNHPTCCAAGLANLEIVRDRETREPFPNLGDAGFIATAAFERGLIARALFQCVALAPPLCASEADIDRMVAILEDVWPDAEARAAQAA